jgi:type II secretion system protein H
MRHPLPTSLRPGFTLIEMLVVSILIGITLGFAAPSVGRSLARMKLERAATAIAADMRLGPSLAARQKSPVRMNIDASGRQYTITDRTSGDVLVSRNLAAGSEFDVALLLSVPDQVDFYPNGIASDSMRITIRSAGQTRIVRMTRAGQVRIIQ